LVGAVAPGGVVLAAGLGGSVRGAAGVDRSGVCAPLASSLGPATRKIVWHFEQRIRAPWAPIFSGARRNRV